MVGDHCTHFLRAKTLQKLQIYTFAFQLTGAAVQQMNSAAPSPANPFSSVLSVSNENRRPNQIPFVPADQSKSSSSSSLPPPPPSAATEKSRLLDRIRALEEENATLKLKLSERDGLENDDGPLEQVSPPWRAWFETFSEGGLFLK